MYNLSQFRLESWSPQRWRVLSEAQIEDIHFASLEILERIGIRVNHVKVRKLLSDAGARISQDSNIVKLPPALVEFALRVAPSKITVYDRLGNPKLHLEGHKVHYGTLVDAPYFHDFVTGKHISSKREHVPLIAKLTDALENVEFVNPAGTTQDIPIEISNRLVFKDVVSNTTLPIIPNPASVKELGEMVEICEIVAGGANRFRERPFLMIYIETLCPLVHDSTVLDILISATELGIPTIYTPMSLAGVTAPVTLSGQLAVINAEVLSAITIAQLVKEGHPCIYGGIPGPMDMRTTRFAYGAPETMLLCAAFTDLAHHYHLPMFGTAGVTDAVKMDGQAAAEIALNCFLALGSGANLVHDVGMFAGADSTSMAAMVFTDEVISMLQRVIQPIDTSAESLALDIVETVGPGGNFLSQKHTLKHHREMWTSNLFKRISVDKWLEEPKQLNERIRDKVYEILEKHQPAPLEQGVLDQLDRMEKSWWKEIDNQRKR